MSTTFPILTIGTNSDGNRGEGVSRLAPDLGEIPLNERAYEHIRRDICTCRLAPGTEVSEAKLSGQYGYGLAAIRKALSHLAQEGLVSAVPRRGYVIKPISLHDFQELMDLRLMIEPKLASLAASGDTRGAGLEELFHGPPDDALLTEQYNFINRNREFHLQIARLAGNTRAVRILDGLLMEVGRMLHVGLFPKGNSPESAAYRAEQRFQHEQLLQAIKGGDATLAEQITKQHLEHSRQLILSSLALLIT